MTDSRIRQARKMREGGMSQNEIAEVLGVGRTTLYQYLGRRRVEGAAINECREAELHAVVGSTDVDRPSAVVPAFILMAMGRRCLGVRRRHRRNASPGGIEIGLDYTRRRREMRADREGFKISSRV
ncbi:helix-turn-helix domain-containing protein [Rhodococcus hoagii]|nr:helix-turn-helix domain-containing protein [Prescottella equi]